MQKKCMTKDERKDFNKALTYHYLKQQENGDEVAQIMEKRLKKCVTDTDDSKEVKLTAPADVSLPPEKVSGVRSYSSKQDH
jgi:hypothetical protein